MSLPIRSPGYMKQAHAIRADYDKGNSIIDVAAHFDMSESQIRRRIREAGGSVRPGPKNGYASDGPIEVYVLPKEPISYAELSRQTELPIRTLLRWAKSGKIPADHIENKWVMYRAEIEAIDMMALKHTRRVVHVNNEPRCACCGILLGGKLGICGLCMKWCIYNPARGEWEQKRIVRQAAG